MPHPRQGYTNKAGEPIPGCTTVLSALNGAPADGLITWGVNLHKQGLDWRTERQRSADVGTFIHDVLETYPNPLPPRPVWMTEEEWAKTIKAYSDYASWYAAINPKIVAHEVQLVSEELQCGGTFDLILDVAGALIIADHKTGKSIDKPKVAAQLACYALMARENGIGGDIKEGLILHYTAKGLKPVKLNEAQMAAGLELFKTARKAYGLFKSFPRN